MMAMPPGPTSSRSASQSACVASSGERRERRELGIEAEGAAVTFRYRCLRAGQRVPDGIVEHVHDRHLGTGT